MKAIVKASGREVEIEMIPDDPTHVFVFGAVYLRTHLDAAGWRPVHVVPISKLQILEGDHAQLGSH